MAAPPSPPYPKNCGDDWDKVGLVTGQLPGKGTFGKQFQKGLQPLANKADLKNIGSDLQDQQDLETIIQDKIDTLEDVTLKNSGEGGARRILTVKEEASVVWLLDRAKAELKAANKLWDKWEDRPYGRFPLSYGDTLKDMPGDVGVRTSQNSDQPLDNWCAQPDTSGHRPAPRYGTLFASAFGTVLRCPTTEELKQRPKDRAKIKQRFGWALMYVRCADFGLHRILLYKKALAEWHEVDLPSDFAPEKPPGPDFGGPDSFKAPPTGPGGPTDFKAPSLPDEDLCAMLGIGCPGGVAPPTPEGMDPECPSDFCIDPDALPDPDDVSEGDEAPVAPTRPKSRPKTYSTGAVVTAGLIGAGAVYGLVRLLTPR
jgi:hypothetical protein